MDAAGNRENHQYMIHHRHVQSFPVRPPAPARVNVNESVYVNPYAHALQNMNRNVGMIHRNVREDVIRPNNNSIEMIDLT